MSNRPSVRRERRASIGMSAGLRAVQMALILGWVLLLAGLLSLVLLLRLLEQSGLTVADVARFLDVL